MIEFVADTNLLYAKPELIEQIANERSMRPRVSSFSAQEILCVAKRILKLVQTATPAKMGTTLDRFETAFRLINKSTEGWYEVQK